MFIQANIIKIWLNLYYIIYEKVNASIFYVIRLPHDMLRLPVFQYNLSSRL